MIPVGSPDVELLLDFFTFLITTYLGITVYLQDRRSWTNRLFMILAVFIDTYIVVNYLSLHPPLQTPENQLMWIRIVIFVCSFIGPTLVLFVCTFPGKEITLRMRYRLALYSLMTTSALAALTPLVFSSIQYPHGEAVPVPGPGVFIFFLDFAGLFLLSSIILLYKYKKAIGEDKARQRVLLFGVLVSFSLMAISTVVFVVIFKTSAAVFLGPIFSLILMAFISYSIVKHQLFHTKVVATKLLVAIIWIALLSKVFVFQSATELAIDVFILVLVVVFGILLVRSIDREIHQREEVTRLAESLEKANLRLQELDQQKTEFLSIASHQLRTPLSILKGYIELIKDGAYGKPSKKLSRILEDMDESNERLVKLVDEFLDISRIEQGRTKFSFSLHDPVEIVESTLKEIEGRAKDKKLTLAWEKADIGMVLMDDEKIRHVIFNFVDNAIKYSDRGTVRVSLEKEKDGMALRVEDQGLGFNKTDEVNFYQKFYRGENVKNTNVNGTGLGLYVCRKFIEAHRGYVWATSDGLGKGSEFGFWIPMTSSAPADAV